MENLHQLSELEYVKRNCFFGQKKGVSLRAFLNGWTSLRRPLSNCFMKAELAAICMNRKQNFICLEICSL